MEITSTSAQHSGRLKIVLSFTLLYLAAEVIGGILTKSLALLADAGHMLTDVGGLAFALFAIRIARRPVSERRTYGYYRAEILAALGNALVLIFISLYILYEAWQRFKTPPEVSSLNMLYIAVVGLIVNIAGMLVLRKSSDESLNMKGAYFEVLSDMLTSIGVIIAAIVMMTTGWYYADPLISALIGLFILPRTWKLLKEAVGILLEGTPSDINPAAVKQALMSVPGVLAVHDIHIWALTSGLNALSAHLQIADAVRGNDVLNEAKSRLADLKIIHTTIQLESAGYKQEDLSF